MYDMKKGKNLASVVILALCGLLLFLTVRTQYANRQVDDMGNPISRSYSIPRQ